MTSAPTGPQSPALESFVRAVESRAAHVAVIGMGYVGLPLAHAVYRADLHVSGLDINQSYVDQMNAGHSHIDTIPADWVAEMRASNRFQATSDPSVLDTADCIFVCVPTPLGKHREPNLIYVETTCRTIAEHLKPGQLVVMVSTTYPGTTRDIVQPILEAGGLKAGKDFFLAYSPEREDPGNKTYQTRTIPRVVGSDDPVSKQATRQILEVMIDTVIEVDDTRSAEATKLTENIFRAVNIALVNELKMIFTDMGINVWDVIDAAKTKPFGYMPFYPGPGLGGHCIPIDPFYLSWIAKAYNTPTRFIQLAGEINAQMPHYVINRLIRALSDQLGKGINGSSVLIVGLGYKKNVGDTRESPALRIMSSLEDLGARTAYHDPFIPQVPVTRAYPHLAGRESAAWDVDTLRTFDAAIIVTDHDRIDYTKLLDAVPVVVDTRNVLSDVTDNTERVVLA